MSLLLRISLPKLWCGLKHSALCERSGISGCVFVNPNGAIGCNETREGVQEMAMKSLEDYYLPWVLIGAGVGLGGLLLLQLLSNVEFEPPPMCCKINYVGHLLTGKSFKHQKKGKGPDYSEEMKIKWNKAIMGIDRVKIYKEVWLAVVFRAGGH